MKTLLDTFTITDDGKEFTSALLQKCKDKFPVWSYWDDKELDEDFPKPKTATTRYFKKVVEADEENANKSANELKQEDQITIRERILMELAYFEETGGHLDKDNWTLCAGSRDRDGNVPRACWGGDGFDVYWYDPTNRNPSRRSRSCIDPSTLNLVSLDLVSRISTLESQVEKLTKMTSPNPQKKVVRRVSPIEVDSPWFYQLDPRARAEYIGVRRGIVSYTQEIRNGLLIDLDSRGNILGIEILSSLPTHKRKTKKRI